MGLAGGLAAYMMVLAAGPDNGSLEAYAALRRSLEFVTNWLILPSLVVALTSGLLAMAAHYPFMNAPWVWIKALSGVLIFEAALGIDAAAQHPRAKQEAARGSCAGAVPG